jgi:hypothetical protein
MNLPKIHAGRVRSNLRLVLRRGAEMRVPFDAEPRDQPDLINLALRELVTRGGRDGEST